MISYENEGVAVFTATEEDAGKRADSAVLAALAQLSVSLSRSALQKLIEGGSLTKNGAPVAKNTKLCAGDELILTFPEPEISEVLPENIPLDVLYEDDDIIIVNKPKGMVVHPAPGHTSGTLVSALLYRCGDSLSGIGGVMRPGIVHRIDRDTEGLICAAKNDSAHIFLSEQLKSHTMRRTYEAICVGRLRDEKGRIEAPIGRSRSDRKKMAVVPDGRYAATNYTLLEEFSASGMSASHLKLELETGRTHQIRVHMAYIGHPLLGDELYGGASTHFERRHPSLFEGQCLQAVALRLTHPRTGEEMEFSCPLSENFCQILKLLREGK